MLRINHLSGFGRIKASPPPVHLIDAVGASASAAYGVRKLRSAYSGSALRIRRSSDSTEQDIGFSGDDLDWADASSFIGGGSGFVRTWYDQSGNGLDAGQATAADQPGLDLANQRINFDGTNDFLETASNIGISGDANVTAFVLGRNTVNSRYFFGFGAVSALNGFGCSRNISSTDLALVFVGGNTFTATASDLANLSLITARKAAGPIDTGMSFYQNGSLLTPAVTPATTPNITNAPLRIGTAWTTGQYLNGSLKELVIFPSALSSTPRSNGEANIMDYYGL